MIWTNYNWPRGKNDCAKQLLKNNNTNEPFSLMIMI